MRGRSLQLKLILPFGLILLMVAGLIIGWGFFTGQKLVTYVSNTARNNATQAVKALLLEKGRSIADRLEARMAGALNTAQVLANTFSGIKDPDVRLKMNRAQLNGILQSTLRRNTDFYALYTIWEPNALDQLDPLYVGAKGYDQTGRFIPYWYREAEGAIRLIPVRHYDGREKYPNGLRKAEPYLLAKEKKADCLIDPHPCWTDNAFQLVSLVSPILVQGKFYGAVGVDLRLDIFQKMAQNVDLTIKEGVGRVGIISPRGIVAGASDNPDLLGKAAQDWMPEEAKGFIADIGAGKEKIARSDRYLRTMVPLDVAGAAWAVILEMPWQEAMAGVTSLMAQMVQQGEQSIFWQIAVATAVALFGLIFVWWIARRISVPIKQVIQGLQENYFQLTAASQQIRGSSGSLAQGANKQAGSVEEASAALEQMDSMIKQTAENARQTYTLMQENNRTVAETRGSMDQLNSSMADISRSSEQTFKIMKTIDELAFQTSLLALNAAVEAARAGQAGAGFAVVADEVRNLALRSAEAAQDTSELIESTVETIHTGAQIVEKTHQSFSQMAQNVVRGSELVGEIAAAADEQAQGIEQVSQAMNDIDRITQQNASDAQQSAASAQEMNSQAEQMHRFVEALLRLVGERRDADGKTAPSALSAKKPTKKPAKKRALPLIAWLKGRAKAAVPKKITK